MTTQRSGYRQGRPPPQPKQCHRDYWLKRFTPAEIVELALAIWPELVTAEPFRSLGPWHPSDGPPGSSSSAANAGCSSSSTPAPPGLTPQQPPRCDRPPRSA